MKARLFLFLTCAALLAPSLQAQVHVRVDAGVTQTPISPYIYGQFIEHLGRCIYGGIWAEMLEDRKFYYPVTDDYAPWGTATDAFWKAGAFAYLTASPWKVLGPPGTVTMDTVAAFVGAHTPVVHLSGDGSEAGISQEALAVVQGKTYTGHIVLAGSPTTAPIEVRLILDDGTVLRQSIAGITDEYRTYPFSFEAPASGEDVRLEVISRGRGAFQIGTLTLMPAENLGGWRPEVVGLLRELNAPVYRWPGGNFVSGYNWRDGVGPRDRRPPRKNPAWRGVEHNDVGLHEYMALMELLGAEAFVAVNTGLGGVEEVAEEVAYANAPADTPMGRLRAEHGHPAPFAVRWWAVGNEMYGDWQLGHMPLEDYVQKHNRVAEAMWAADPDIQLIGVGETGTWSETMLRDAGDHMNLISEHIYAQDDPDVPTHAHLLADMIDRKAEAHRRYRQEIEGLAAKDIRIAMDEWNHWYGDYLYGELGVRYHMKDALGVATGLHAFFRNSDLYFMANYAQTVNVIGAIKTSRTDAAFDATGLPLVLYRQHFGTIPVSVEGDTGAYDIAAAWTADRTALTIAVVNPTPQAGTVALDVTGASPAGTGTRWVIAHPDPEAYNEPGKPPVLTIETSAVQGLSLEVPGYGIVLYRFDARRP